MVKAKARKTKADAVSEISEIAQKRIDSLQAESGAFEQLLVEVSMERDELRTIRDAQRAKIASYDSQCRALGKTIDARDQEIAKLRQVNSWTAADAPKINTHIGDPVHGAGDVSYWYQRHKALFVDFCERGKLINWYAADEKAEKERARIVAIRERELESREAELDSRGSMRLAAMLVLAVVALCVGCGIGAWAW